MNHVVTWFEMPVTDMERAKQFYAAVMQTGFTDDDMDGYKMAVFDHEEEAVGGMLVQAEDYKPSQTGAVIYLNGGDDLSAALNRAIENGGAELIPKTAINDGECGYYAHFLDTEGNRVGLYSLK